MLASVLKLLVLISGLTLAVVVGVVALLTKRQRGKLAVAGVAVALAVLSVALYFWIPTPPTSYQLVRPVPIDDAATLFYSNRALYAVRVRDGTVRWQHPTPGPTYFAWSTPTLDNGVLYVSSRNTQSENGGYVAAIRASDGTEIWRVEPPELGTLQVVGGSLVVVSDSVLGSQLEVLRLSDGVEVRTLSVPEWYGTPVLDDSAAYGCQSDGALVALRLSDGQPAWRTAIDPSLTNPPSSFACFTTLVDGILYVQTQVASYLNAPEDDLVAAVRASDGRLLWRYDTGPSTPLAVNNGTICTVVYGATSTDPDTAIALRSSDGSLLWQRSLGIVASKTDTLTAAGSAVYAGLRGSLLALRPSDGALLWQRKDASTRVLSAALALDAVVFVQSSFSAPGPAYANGFAQDYLQALSPSDGALYWQTAAQMLGSPAAASS